MRSMVVVLLMPSIHLLMTRYKDSGKIIAWPTQQFFWPDSTSETDNEIDTRFPYLPFFNIDDTGNVCQAVLEH